jgi:2-C-methyl-D-erythritol 4-phosphate cytidylyltransferase
MEPTKIVLIVAGGRGERMQSEVPKQFIEVAGKPILMHTVEAFIRYDSNLPVFVVLPADQIDFWENLCSKYAFKFPHHLVVGGETRFHSVKNGLAAVSEFLATFYPDQSEKERDIALIAVHDGVRPLVSEATIRRCFDEAEKFGTAIPSLDLIDSLRSIHTKNSQSLDRSAFKLVQTPQVFYLNFLQQAYKQEFSPLFTDDASVVESIGLNVHLTEGNRENIKLTTAFDLELASFLLAKRENSVY